MELYTIGYGRLTFIELLPLLRKYEIESVVDVRSAPYSKFSPEFCKSSLNSLLTAQGIKYVFISNEKGDNQLGGMPKDHSVQVDGQVSYELLREKDYFKEGISKLRNLAKDRRICLLCAEEDPNRCHRQHLITKTLLVQGINVLHIRVSGVIEEAVNDQEQSLLTKYF